MMTTTLNRINRYAQGCSISLTFLLQDLYKTMPEHEPLPFTTILEQNGLEDALFCCRAEPKYNREWRLFAVWSARRVVEDKACLSIINVAEQYAYGKISRKAFERARVAAFNLRAERAPANNTGQGLHPVGIAAYTVLPSGAEAAFHTSSAVLGYIAIQSQLSRSAYNTEKIAQIARFRRVSTSHNTQSKRKRTPKRVWKIWCDGACEVKKPRPCAWGAVITSPEGTRTEHSGFIQKNGTKNIAALTAALESLRRVPEGATVILCLDSYHTLNGLKEWIPVWIDRNWKTSKKTIVPNKEIWQELHKEYMSRHVTLEWARAHAIRTENEWADKLARIELQEECGKS